MSNWISDSTRSGKEDLKRLPGLDGLRAISILLVLCGPLEARGFYNNPTLWTRTGDIANLGIRVFFVISGYLITLLLLREGDAGHQFFEIASAQ